MELWISALAGVLLLAGALISGSLKKKKAAPVYRYLTVIFGVLAALCFFYCVSAFLLIAGID